jgi:NAD(P)-dependent dehydrogenase (short-subunit alcohol dehydrogenase family)
MMPRKKSNAETPGNRGEVQIIKHLNGKVAIVTGSASGIGRGCALALGRAGVSVAVTDINLEGAKTVAAEIRDAGGNAIGERCDVGVDGEFEALRDLVLKRFGRIDIVMNNAGTILSGNPEDVPLSEWQRVFNVNLLSIVRSNAVFLPIFLANGQGHFVNTASFAGLYTYSFDRLPYAASKAAVIQMSEGLALYLRPKGIGVTVLCPGPVMTNIMSSARVFTEGVELRGPGSEFGLMNVDQVGELVVEAIRNNVFFLPTHPQVRERLIRRAQDVDANLQEQIDHPHILNLDQIKKS